MMTNRTPITPVKTLAEKKAQVPVYPFDAHEGTWTEDELDQMELDKDAALARYVWMAAGAFVIAVVLVWWLA